MTARRKAYSFLAILVILAAGGYAWRYHPSWFGRVAKASSTPETGKDKSKDQKEPTPVELATASRGHISSFVSSTANLRAMREVSITPQVEGIVQKLLVEEGDFVKDGQVLCILDDAQHRLRSDLAAEKLGQAKLQLEKARIRMDKAAAQKGHTQIELTRYERAHKEGLVSEREVASYRYRLEEFDHDQRVGAAEMKELAHRMAELEGEIAQARLDMSRARVAAPFAGYVTQRTVNLGQRIRVGDPMFNIGSFSPLYADVFLSEREARAARPGLEATIRLDAADSTSVRGRVIRLSPIVDQATGTVKVTVELQPTSPLFRPGAFARVEIRSDTHANAVLIPKRAIVEEDGQHYVYIAKGTSAQRVKIDLGFEHDGKVEIRAGVNDGQKVVVAGQGALKQGGPIKVIQG